MYKVDHYYSSSRAHENTFESYEDALAYAESQASKDFEDMTWMVHEVKAITKADLIKNPIKTVTSENLTAFLEHEKSEENDS